MEKYFYVNVVNPGYYYNDEQFKVIHPILNRADTSFILTEEDINSIFEFKNRLNYEPKENKELIKELQRVRNITQKSNYQK